MPTHPLEMALRDLVVSLHGVMQRREGRAVIVVRSTILAAARGVVPLAVGRRS